MGRLLALLLLFYIGIILTRFIANLLRQVRRGTDADHPDKSSPPPWKDEDVQEGKFEDIE